MKLIDAAIEREAGKQQPDGQKLSWLATASARLEVQEQKLSNRPGPGSRRPREDREPRNITPVALMVEEVAKVAPLALPAPAIGHEYDEPAKPPGWEYDDPTPTT